MGIAISVLGKFQGTLDAYKEASVGELDLVSGRLEALIRSTGSLAPLHKDEHARILAVSGSRRCPARAGRPNLEGIGDECHARQSGGAAWSGGMPPALVQRIHEAIRTFVNDPAVVPQLHAYGMIPWPMGSTEVAKWAQDERQKIAALAQGKRLCRVLICV